MAKQRGSAQQVRIIGGKWKGRKLHFSGNETLRPTLGRTRETLFNWLRPDIAGMRCLDAFAGSGILGFEALSQGAAEVVFVEQNQSTVSAIKKSAATLNALAHCQIEKGDAVSFLGRTKVSFDIAFLDPPFAQPDLLHQCLALLAKQVEPCRLVYAEARTLDTLQKAADKADFDLIRQTKSGNTAAGLLSPNQDIAGRLAQG